MREILFRGKRADNGEWVEGYIMRRPSAIQFEEHCSPWYIYIPPRDPDDSGGCYNVVKETLGQFTGLTANGKKIFEGDVVEEQSEIFGEVCRCRLIVGDIWAISLLDPDTKLEVIGNIHDNPELLEDKHE